MSTGWIRLHRQLLDWEWYDDINTSRLFIHLMLTANHKDNKWRGIEIKRGSRLTSLDRLSSETNLSVSKIRTAIKKLISTNEIASKSHSQHTVFIMNNYDEYQGDDKQDDKRVTNESQTNDKRIATNKNDKNEKNDNKEISLVDAKPQRAKYKYSEVDHQCAEWFYNLVLNVAPKAKKPNLESWANTIRLMGEVDNITHGDISEVFVWANKDSFWSVNILSPAKLRDKFAQLQAKMKVTPISGNNVIEQLDDKSWADGLDDVL